VKMQVGNLRVRTFNDMNYVLEENVEIKKTKTGKIIPKEDRKKEWKFVGYYSWAVNALSGLLKTSINRSEVEGVESIITAINETRQMIKEECLKLEEKGLVR